MFSKVQTQQTLP